MPVCTHCQYEWTWTETMKRSFTFEIGWPCPNCKKRQYPSRRAQRRYLKYTLLIPFCILLLLTGIPKIYTLTIFIIVAIIVLLIYPFTLELSKEEELPFS
ncbi:MAG TPA: TIGR04104 family putative zinc finger protein [Bacillota bacterium]|nr:TIGR04104 family putative zinc finger protein [Bacillota bacterium]